jgi:hypothetical protein
VTCGGKIEYVEERSDCRSKSSVPVVVEVGVKVGVEGREKHGRGDRSENKNEGRIDSREGGSVIALPFKGIELGLRSRSSPGLAQWARCVPMS